MNKITACSTLEKQNKNHSSISQSLSEKQLLEKSRRFCSIVLTSPLHHPLMVFPDLPHWEQREKVEAFTFRSSAALSQDTGWEEEEKGEEEEEEMEEGEEDQELPPPLLRFPWGQKLKFTSQPEHKLQRWIINIHIHSVHDVKGKGFPLVCTFYCCFILKKTAFSRTMEAKKHEQIINYHMPFFSF